MVLCALFLRFLDVANTTVGHLGSNVQVQKNLVCVVFSLDAGGLFGVV